MPLIPNISFNVRFDLTGVPTLVLTDTSTIPAGGVGIFNVTTPDGYTRTGSFSTPDITASGQSFSLALFLSSAGSIQNGQYNIEYKIKTTDNVISTFTRNWQMAYEVPVINLRNDFDVFTPRLRYYDDTTYQVSNFNNGAVTRTWAWSSVPSGAQSGSGAYIQLQYNSAYYDAYYTITLTASTLYTHQVYTWLTVNETVSKTVNTSAATPPTLLQLVTLISALKTELDRRVDEVLDLQNTRNDFEYSVSLFMHIIDKIKVQNLSNIYRDLNDLIAVLHNYQIPNYTPLNVPILPYDLSTFFPGAVWGNITGTLSSQTDLWTILQTLTIQTNYVHDQQVASASWVILHNMGKKPSVSIVDTADDEVIAKVTYNSNNQVTLTFSSPISGKAYLN
jgi:hypothetical protein